MKNEMLISRFDKWFQYVDSELDYYYLAYKIMETLHNRPKSGLVYNRLELIREVSNRSSSESLRSLDQAITILKAKDVICFIKENELKTRIFLTEYGKEKFMECKGKLK